MKIAISLLLILSLISCSYRPVLDENYKYNATSKVEIDGDIDSCQQKADEYLSELKKRRVAKKAVRKGAIGAFFGGIFSFIFGGNVSSLIRGVGVGAAVGAASGAVITAGEGKITPDEIKQRYVTNCLSRKGYSVIGWQ